MNYREKIRKAIECPQFGNETYGEWGALRFEQRVLIKRLLDELDSADNCFKKVYLENQELKKQLEEKENKYIPGEYAKNEYTKTFDENILLKNQQKELIEYLEDEIEKVTTNPYTKLSEYGMNRIHIYKEILQKYKEIIGGRLNVSY